MNYFCGLCALWLVASFLSAYGQKVTLSQPHPITQSELARSLIPVVVENDNRHYFIKHVYHSEAHYGGILSKEWLTLDQNLLSFYTSSLFHVDVQRKGGPLSERTLLPTVLIIPTLTPSVVSSTDFLLPTLTATESRN